jgi:lipopolysaccharide/colanic/teichoic acid biosynthesis glycosyltransferase
MYVEAESQSGAAQVIRDDPRVTRVGRILRRTSLDELP